MVGGNSATRSPHTTDNDRATESPDVYGMVDAHNIALTTPLPQRNRNIATTKMDATNDPDVATIKMAITLTCHVTASSKMTSTGFKAMTYNPNMPLEMAEDLPPSAGLIIQLIQDLRVYLKK
ncbi:Hypothetical predicted protein [Pelobates cultripes]|uniref:Uncharacterized protein n=1 Tax=Pelobates cultripes TaxID=61616 RepID=A0AAD1R6Y3_PELCU|nr:Hypothetical predicted protein [Pelobates cultripes]